MSQLANSTKRQRLWWLIVCGLMGLTLADELTVFSLGWGPCSRIDRDESESESRGSEDAEDAAPWELDSLAEPNRRRISPSTQTAGRLVVRLQIMGKPAPVTISAVSHRNGIGAPLLR